jgi:protein-S-isoprenylcysteine O-methyltransferase Ste14
MIGLVILYFIGKAYFGLAQQYQKNGWAYAILGVVTYYAGTFIAGFILVLGFDLFGMTTLNDLNERALGAIALPFGLLLCWLVYQYLKRNWTKVKTDENSDILDAGFMD